MAGDSPLKGYYLTRLYRDGSDPFAVVSDLPRDEAVVVCSKFAGSRQVGGKPGDQGAYMEGRVETESWLREQAAGAGVDIRKDNPVYFTLTKEPQDDMAPPGKKIVSIPAESLDLSCCSFTFGDSMSRTGDADEYARNPLAETVMNVHRAAAVVAERGLQGDYIHGGMYMEVQMWARPSDITQTPAPSAPVARAAAPAISSAKP